eukprot:s4222_g2.t1
MGGLLLEIDKLVPKDHWHSHLMAKQVGMSKKYTTALTPGPAGTMPCSNRRANDGAMQVTPTGAMKIPCRFTCCKITILIHAAWWF